MGESQWVRRFRKRGSRKLTIHDFDDVFFEMADEAAYFYSCYAYCMGFCWKHSRVEKAEWCSKETETHRDGVRSQVQSKVRWNSTEVFCQRIRGRAQPFLKSVILAFNVFRAASSVLCCECSPTFLFPCSRPVRSVWNPTSFSHWCKLEWKCALLRPPCVPPFGSLFCKRVFSHSAPVCTY